MEIQKTPLDGVLILQPRVWDDPRGCLYEWFNASRFQKLGIHYDWRQDNYSFSVKNTLRGLHFTRGAGQAKLVHCIQGRVWDVVVDLRMHSPTRGQTVTLELSGENRTMLLMAEGFAHGYAVLSDTAQMVYKLNREYDVDLEDGLMWNDPQLKIPWPVEQPLLSERDQHNHSYEEYLRNIAPIQPW